MDNQKANPPKASMARNTALGPAWRLWKPPPESLPPLGVKQEEGVWLLEGQKELINSWNYINLSLCSFFITVVVLFPVFNFSPSSLSLRTSP